MKKLPLTKTLSYLFLICATLFSVTVFADQLNVNTTPGAHFSALQKQYGKNTQIPAFLEISFPGSPANSKNFTQVYDLGDLNDSAINQTTPMQNLAGWYFSPPGFVKFSYNINEMNGNQVVRTLYSCSRELYLKRFNKKTNYQLILNGAESNTCSLIIERLK